MAPKNRTDSHPASSHSTSEAPFPTRPPLHVGVTYLCVSQVLFNGKASSIITFTATPPPPPPSFLPSLLSFSIILRLLLHLTSFLYLGHVCGILRYRLLRHSLLTPHIRPFDLGTKPPYSTPPFSPPIRSLHHASLRLQVLIGCSISFFATDFATLY